MQALTNYVFYKERTTASTDADMNPYINKRGDTLCLELAGTATSFTVALQGRSNITNGGTWFNISGIKLTDLTKATSATATGLYEYDISGAQEVRVNITSITGGNITAFGRIVETGC